MRRNKVKSIGSQNSMSSSNAYEVVVDEVWEHQIVIRFDYPRRQDGPQTRAMILRSLGYGVVTFVGIDPNEAQVGDVVVEITHNDFYTHVQIWLKLRNGAKGWGSTSTLHMQYHYTLYLV